MTTAQRMRYGEVLSSYAEVGILSYIRFRQPGRSHMRSNVKDLEGITVVALEQAVAAPYASSRLADAGARAIKIERAEGDFARRYDSLVNGDSAYFVWLNRGKQSICMNLKDDGDKALLAAVIAKADVFIQNLAPGAVERMGFGLD